MQRVLNLTSLSMRRSTEIVWIPNIWKFLLHSFFKLWNLFSARSFVFRRKFLHLGFTHAACNWMRAGANWESHINKGIVGKPELTVCCYCCKNAGLFVCLCVTHIFCVPQPEQSKQTRPGSSSAEPRQGHMTSSGSELCHLMSHSAASLSCRIHQWSLSALQMRLAPQTAKRKQFIIQKLNSNELPKWAEALTHRLSLSKLATRRLFPIECWREKVRFLLPLVAVHRSQLCASAELLIAARHTSWHKTETFLQSATPLWVSTRSLGNWQA